jgi:alkanesulfonate monooxygenase SsuD/methylene tetrahydromethanopterin reductase-like flavin-dependent oxidoreductase (luciferase family)
MISSGANWRSPTNRDLTSASASSTILIPTKAGCRRRPSTAPRRRTPADGGIGYQRLAESHARRGNPGGAEIARHAIDVEYLRERNLAFVGSPKTVIEQIKAAASEGLFNTVMGEFNIGAIAEEDLMRSIRLFGSEVIPALREFEPY